MSRWRWVGLAAVVAVAGLLAGVAVVVGSSGPDDGAFHQLTGRHVKAVQSPVGEPVLAWSVPAASTAILGSGELVAHVGAAPDVVEGRSAVDGAELWQTHLSGRVENFVDLGAHAAVIGVMTRDHRGRGNSVVSALDVDSGRVRWSHEVGAADLTHTVDDTLVLAGDAAGGGVAMWLVSISSGRMIRGPFVVETYVNPTTTGELVVVDGGWLVGLDPSTGTRAWEADVVAGGRTWPDSIAVTERSLVFLIDDEVVALSRRDRSVRWRAPAPDSADTLFGVDSRRIAVVGERTWVYDDLAGALLWERVAWGHVTRIVGRNRLLLASDDGYGWLTPSTGEAETFYPGPVKSSKLFTDMLLVSEPDALVAVDFDGVEQWRIEVPGQDRYWFASADSAVVVAGQGTVRVYR